MSEPTNADKTDKKSNIQALIKLATDMWNLVVLEAKLAGRSLILIVLLTILLFGLIIVSGLTLLVLLFLLLIHIGLHSLSAVLFIFVFNIVLIGLLVLFIYQQRKNLYFKATRKHLNFTEDLRHESHKNTN